MSDLRHLHVLYYLCLLQDDLESILNLPVIEPLEIYCVLIYLTTRPSGARPDILFLKIGGTSL